MKSPLATRNLEWPRHLLFHTSLQTILGSRWSPLVCNQLNIFNSFHIILTWYHIRWKLESIVWHDPLRKFFVYDLHILHGMLGNYPLNSSACDKIHNHAWTMVFRGLGVHSRNIIMSLRYQTLSYGWSKALDTFSALWVEPSKWLTEKLDASHGR